MAEKAENFKLTDQIYQKGMKKQAEPKDLLSKRYQQFQRRLARHYLNLADHGDVGGSESGGGGGTGGVRSSSSGGQSGSALGGGGGEREQRRVLGGLSQGQADGTDRVDRGHGATAGTYEV